ncbi:C2 calcium/lipid-binding plant phosphoribosyltransferase family protein [Rhynchospora pubera]|uniref:C2 calcium/lipid-binding plant phosphoribosyltransferase family protein n=1 Tax=Rhynchospora pubera TaxID=906938 RepID=A0AAV8CV97_9POAL|nr:C2 calcium/lipid-binding plant phosphoribosyltransferase family protein [Rhynchospora pubera]
MKLAVEVLNAVDLMPKDGQGSASPYVQVEIDGQIQRTKTVHKDLFPSFSQTLFFNLHDPSHLPNQSIEVSLYHDRTTTPGAVTPGQNRNFLGRVKISGESVAPSPDTAEVQRYPLEKRGLFSHIRGDVALRVYLVPDSVGSTDPDPIPVNDPLPIPAFTMPESVGSNDEKVEKKVKNKVKEKEIKEKETHMFYSLGAGAGMGMGMGPAGEVKEPIIKPNVVFHEKLARPEPPPAMVHVRPPFPMMGAGPRPEFGLVETRPPLAGRATGNRLFGTPGNLFNAPGGIFGTPGSVLQGEKIASTYDLVEQMRYLYVTVVKARDLPSKDITGSLDPYVEVKLGNYKGMTRVIEKNQYPVWDQVFAFNRDHIQSNMLEVVLKDKDLIKDDYVGRVVFDLTEVPLRVPPDSPLAPQWYRLEAKSGNKLPKGEVMLSVWIGTQADEAFPDAWHSDAHSVSTLEGLANTRSKVYFSPKLVYLRITVIGAQDLIPADKSRLPNPAVKIQVGHQLRRTRPVTPSINPMWHEEFMFVTSEPFDEPIVITVEDRVGPGRDEPIGRIILPVQAAQPRFDHSKPVEPKWFSLAKPVFSSEENGEKKESKFSSKVHLRLTLEFGYHVLDESTHYSSDLQPAAKHLKKPSIGILELGILSARNLMPMKPNRGTDAYCVAKYGSKWVRTRTLLSTLCPQWNEQYTWEVFDPCTVVTIAVFDNCHVGGQNGEVRDQRIGKVRIRLSTLETDRVYTHFHPLLVLQPSGLKKTGELHLAVRFTCTAWVNMVASYGLPLLPKMHYVQPISVMQLDFLRQQAMQIVAMRLGRAEPPLRREVVEYMLDVDSHMFSLRRSKANFYRIISLFSGFAAAGRWFDMVRNWRNPVTTILVHVLFVILVCYPELILPTIFLYLFLIGIWNYRFRSRHPPHMDTKLSHAELAHPDELDEEFDTFPTSRAADMIRMRYDRLRSVAGRVQTVVGDLATQGERAQALLSWRDPRGTAIFIFIALVVAIVLYVTPFQVLLVAAGLYLLRHPRFRSRMPSVPFNFYRRLPAKSDSLL